jgi:hypothetical protein
METKNREKILAIAAGVCAGLWLFNLLVITPMTNAWHRRSAQIDSLRKAIAEGTMLIRRQDTVRGRWDYMRTNSLSSNPTVAERQLFVAFDRWVGASGVTEGSFRPQLHETDDNYSTIECRADVTGTPEAITQFLFDMEKDPIGVKLESCELTSRDDNGRQLALALDMSGLILPTPNP